MAGGLRTLAKNLLRTYDMTQGIPTRPDSTFRDTWLWQFCLKQVRRNRTIHLFVGTIWKRANFLAKSFSSPRRSLAALKLYSDPAARRTVAGPETVLTPVPRAFPATCQKYLVSPHTQYQFPETYISTIGPALVCANTNLIFTDSAVVCHDLYDAVRDYTSEEVHGKTYMWPARNRIAWMFGTTPHRTLDCAAIFTDACSANYAHWMTEVLPRIHLFCRSGAPATIPVVVDDGLHPNMLHALQKVVGAGREIIALPKGQRILVKNLTVVSVAGYVPFERRTNRIGNHSHGKFSPMALASLREHLQDGLPDSASPKKRIMVRRNSGIRRILNELEIEEMLVKRGFTAVSPETLTFAEQIELFSHAEVIVGATGAAFANLIFCKPSTKIIIMIPAFKHTSYWYWQNMACATGNHVTYVLGKITRSFRSGIHSDFHVNPGDLIDALEWLAAPERAHS
jgi:capsular polysaccharide biosynthesis protein